MGNKMIGGAAKKASNSVVKSLSHTHHNVNVNGSLSSAHLIQTNSNVNVGVSVNPIDLSSKTHDTISNFSNSIKDASGSFAENAANKLNDMVAYLLNHPLSEKAVNGLAIVSKEMLIESSKLWTATISQSSDKWIHLLNSMATMTVFVILVTILYIILASDSILTIDMIIFKLYGICMLILLTFIGVMLGHFIHYQLDDKNESNKMIYIVIGICITIVTCNNIMFFTGYYQLMNIESSSNYYINLNNQPISQMKEMILKSINSINVIKIVSYTSVLLTVYIIFINVISFINTKRYDINNYEDAEAIVNSHIALYKSKVDTFELYMILDSLSQITNILLNSTNNGKIQLYNKLINTIKILSVQFKYNKSYYINDLKSTEKKLKKLIEKIHFLYLKNNLFDITYKTLYDKLISNLQSNQSDSIINKYSTVWDTNNEVINLIQSIDNNELTNEFLNQFLSININDYNNLLCISICYKLYDLQYDLFVNWLNGDITTFNEHIGKLSMIAMFYNQCKQIQSLEFIINNKSIFYPLNLIKLAESFNMSTIQFIDSLLEDNITKLMLIDMKNYLTINDFINNQFELKHCRSLIYSFSDVFYSNCYPINDLLTIGYDFNESFDQSIALSGSISSINNLFYLRDGQLVATVLENNKWCLKIWDSNLTTYESFNSHQCFELLDGNLALLEIKNTQYEADLIIYNRLTKLKKTISLDNVHCNSSMIQSSNDTLVLYGTSNIYVLNLLTLAKAVIHKPSEMLGFPWDKVKMIMLSDNRLAIICSLKIVGIFNLALNQFEKYIHLNLRSDIKITPSSNIDFMLQLSDGRLVYFVRFGDSHNFIHYIIIINASTGDTVAINVIKYITSIVELKGFSNRIAVCKGDEQVQIYDITSGSCDSVLGHPSGILSLLLLLDGRLLTLDIRGLLYIWDINSTETWQRKLSASLNQSHPFNFCLYPTESRDGSLANVLCQYNNDHRNYSICIWKRRLS